MFEAVAAVCLGAVCRMALVPGHEAPTRTACEAGGFACQPVGPALEVTEVAPGVFVHVGAVAEPDLENRGDVANLGFVVGERSVAVIDTGSAAWIGEGIWRAVRARTDLPVSHVVLTHMHPDHVFGATVLAGAGAEVVGRSGLARALADRADNYLDSLERLIGAEALAGTGVPVVTVPVDGAMRIDLGGRWLDLRAWPVAHTGTDVTVLDSRTGTLFAGDLVFDQHTPALDGSLRGWLSVLEDLRAQDVARVVPGHGAAALDWPEGSDALQRYLEVLLEDTRAAVAAGERLGDAVSHIAESERGAWMLFEAYNARNATVAFTELEWE